VAQVQFFNGTFSLGIDTGSRIWRPPTIWHGPYTLSAVATIIWSDGDDSVNIVVDAPRPSRSPARRTARLLTAWDITITVTASDSDGSISKVEFFEGVIRLVRLQTPLLDGVE